MKFAGDLDCSLWPLCGSDPLSSPIPQFLSMGLGRLASFGLWILLLLGMIEAAIGRARLIPISSRVVFGWAFLSAKLVVDLSLSKLPGLPLATYLLAAGLLQVGCVLWILWDLAFPAELGKPDRDREYRHHRLTAIFTVLMSLTASSVGSLFASAAITDDCVGGPACFSQLFVHTGYAVHVFIGAAAFLVGITQLYRAWNARETRTHYAIASSITGTLLLLQIPTTLVGIWRGWPWEINLLHISTALGVWISSLTSVLVLAKRKTTHDALQQPVVPKAGRWRAFLRLTKPVIVSLMLVTTLAGMILGEGGMPDLGMILLTLIGGGLLASGASALNQVIDREEDSRMLRTKSRPLPSGQVLQVEALIFGILLCLLGFYLLVLFINPLSGLLGLAGAIYYVCLYSILLKRTTPQNIVVGGGAGAIPPLVGWAAAVGRLDIQAFFLFALVFFWTPPHFWALSLVRTEDYRRAGVPMLPVVFGARETRKQILLYTIQLVVLSMLLPLMELGGGIFLMAASLSGLGLLWFAWRLWQTGGNRTAWWMYRYSSMYLACIFGVLILETTLT